MTKFMKITLSLKSASACWDEKTTFSIDNNGIIIHLNGEDDLNLIQRAARKINELGIKYVALDKEGWDINRSWAFWTGYRGSKYTNNIIWSDLDNLQKKELNNRLDIIDWVRNTINLPAEELGPEQLAQYAINFLCNITSNRHFSWKIIQGETLLKQNHFGLYIVGRGSVRPPVLLELDYNLTGKKETPIYACLVGKGITFDSGGYNIKQSNSMESMKSDMAGAAMVTGSLALAIARGLKKRIKLYLCCADNLISGNSFKLGDIIRYRNGKTVEITNTDAEGRLILADGLINASEQKAELIIDAATLTGAAKIALGNDYHALFSFDNKLAKRFLESAKLENEPFWRLPLSELHRHQLPSNFAELSNTAPDMYPAGASTAAGFLSHFVKNYHEGWLHIDCSAAYHKSSVEQWSAGATGLGVRAIANLLTRE